MPVDKTFKLGDREIAEMFSRDADAERFPPILSLEQAADLLQLPTGTLRDWRSRGLLSGCSRKIGKHVRFIRDRLVKHLFNEGLRDE